MPETLKLWEILEGEKLNELNQSKLDLEKRIEAWIESDITILATDLLLIGRQVTTDYGGIIDLLCLDRRGDVVIVELKRDKTPREVTAQALDYASWVKDLSRERVISIANSYLEDRTLEQAFSDKFGSELPDSLNSQHKVVIVASEIDSSSERIIRYLSDTYGVGINATTFHYFRDNQGRELLARQFLIEPEQVEQKAISTSKRKPYLTYPELQEIADQNGVGNLYKLLSEALSKQFWTNTTTSGITFNTKERSRKALFNLFPMESSPEKGLRFRAYISRLSNYIEIDKNRVLSLLPNCEQSWEEEWSGTVCTGFFQDEEAANNFLIQLSEAWV